MRENAIIIKIMFVHSETTEWQIKAAVPMFMEACKVIYDGDSALFCDRKPSSKWVKEFVADTFKVYSM